MDNPDNSYAPQSPDLSAYQSSYNTDIPPATYYPQGPSPHQHPFPQPQNYGHISDSHSQMTSLPQPPHLNNTATMKTRRPRTESKQNNSDWMADRSSRPGPRRMRQPRIEEDCGLPAPGEIEGIEVKTKFPVARIKRIMQHDEDVGKVAQVTPTAVSKALELFMISTVMKAAGEARLKGSKRVTAAHLKQAVEKSDQMDFLAEIISRAPDAPAPSKKEEDSEDAVEGKKKRGGRKKRKNSDEF